MVAAKDRRRVWNFFLKPEPMFRTPRAKYSSSAATTLHVRDIPSQEYQEKGIANPSTPLSQPRPNSVQVFHRKTHALRVTIVPEIPAIKHPIQIRKLKTCCQSPLCRVKCPLEFCIFHSSLETVY